MSGDIVYAASYWPTNADLIVDVRKMGFIPDGARVLDPTFGRGVWWRKYRPENFKIYNRKEDGSDFRALPEADGSFDVIAWDPPFVATGGDSTSTLPDFNNRYGLHEQTDSDDRMFSSPAELQELMNDGMTEMSRILAVDGYLLSKSKNYVSSGSIWWGVDRCRDHALSLGLVKVAEFYHLSKSGGPQQKNRVRKDGSPVEQKTARNNLSMLTVFQKPRQAASSSSSQSDQSDASVLL